LTLGKAKGIGLLHRRELDGGLPDLDENEPPGFSAKELVDWQRLRPGEKWVFRI
jgi:hypothetical protein